MARSHPRADELGTAGSVQPRYQAPCTTVMSPSLPTTCLPQGAQKTRPGLEPFAVFRPTAASCNGPKNAETGLRSPHDRFPVRSCETDFRATQVFP